MNNFLKIAKDIQHLIASSNPIIIHRHINPDGDALGSQFALKTIIEDNFPHKTVLVPGESSEYLKTFFPELSVVTKDNYQGALVIICDTANRERISGEFWQSGKKIIKIDHHPLVDDYADISLVDETASAACQVIAKWAEILKLKVSPRAARNLFFGLVTDSGRFLYRSVSAETFHTASFLLQQNFNLLDLYQQLYLQDIKSICIKGYILSNFEITQNGVAYLIFNDKIVKELITIINKKTKNLSHTNESKVKISNEDLVSHVNVLANIVGIKIWLLVADTNIDNDIKVSVRSSRWIINETVAKFGGGGHQVAAGVRLKDSKDIMALVTSLDKVAQKEPDINN